MNINLTILKRLSALLLISILCSTPLRTLSSPGTSTSAESREKKQIAFVSHRNGRPEIFLMNSDGSNQQALKNPDDRSYASDPSWSPNGNHLAHSLHYEDGRDTLLYVTNADTLNQQIIAVRGSDIPAQPTWSPDTKQMAYVSNQDSIWKIYVITLDTKVNYRLTSVASNKPRTDYRPIWSPAGKYIAFLSDEEYGINSELHIVQLDGKGEQVLASDVQAPMPFSWSPDGERIAFITTKGQLCNVDLNKQRRCFEKVKNGSSPSWSPDGSFIAFSEQNGQIYNIFMITSDGVQIRQITDDKTHHAFNPIWSRDGNFIAFVSSEDNEGSNIVVVDVEQLSQHKLTIGRNYSPAWQP